jgi:Plavaka transposase
MWRRDPVECVRELLGNPALKNHMKYAPERVYEDVEKKSQVVDEMWTANWWWDTQVNFFTAQNNFVAYQVSAQVAEGCDYRSVDSFI